MTPASAEEPPPKFQRILGIKFFLGSPRGAMEYLSHKGGYVVVPAAPALIKICHDPEFRRAVEEADLAIADSGFMALLWRIMEGSEISRISGLTYLKEFFRLPGIRNPNQTYWVLPSKTAEEKARAWLGGQGFELPTNDTYVAPFYGKVVEDAELVGRLNAKQPKHVIIGIGGGGPQEKLASYLKAHLSYRPAIHCIGAALGFLTGDQVRIPAWADRFFLGWLFRVLAEPRLFAPRFWSARKLPWLIWKFRDRLPPLEKRDA